MTPEEKQFHEHLKDRKLAYIRSTKAEGGTRDGFVQFVFASYAEDAASFPLLPMLGQATRFVWSTTAPWEQEGDEDDDLFTVAGVALPLVLTIPDATVVGGKRKVSAEYGTIAQVRQHGELVIAGGEHAVAKGKMIVRAADQMLIRARGDPSRRAADFSDRKKAA